MIPAVKISVVILLVCLALNPVSSQGGFPGFGGGAGGFMGGLMGPNPYANNYNRFSNSPLQQPQQTQQHDVLTCINSNRQDPSALIRLSITDQGRSAGQQGPMYGFQQNGDMPTDWLINGYYKGSNIQTSIGGGGSFQVVLTQYGRVQDGCSATAMGPAVRSAVPFGGAMGMGQHPFLNMFGGNSNNNNNNNYNKPAGILSNPMYVSPNGMTIYSGRAHGISRNQLLGGGVAVCPKVNDNGECFGLVIQCCTITKDQIPASEVYINPGQQGQLGGQIGGVGLGGGFGGANMMGGGGLGGGMMGGLGYNNGMNGLGNGLGNGMSMPFAINSGSMLSLTDPNAVMANSASGSNVQQAGAETAGAAGNTVGLF